jgi:ABC-type transporter Mla subunit MlaD
MLSPGSEMEDRMDDPDFASVVDAAERLIREIARLRSDIARLLDRLEPFEEEKTRLADIARFGEVETAKTLPDALKMLTDARREIKNAEYDLNAIRARMDEVANDTMSRDEIKPYLKR